jgi:hypothetical protein
VDDDDEETLTHTCVNTGTTVDGGVLPRCEACAKTPMQALDCVPPTSPREMMPPMTKEKP